MYGKILKYFEKQEEIKVKIFKKVENCKNIKVLRIVSRGGKLKITILNTLILPQFQLTQVKDKG